MRHAVEGLEQALDAAPGRVGRRAVPRELLRRAEVATLVRMAFAEWGMILALWSGLTVAPSWSYPLFVLVLAGRFHALGIVLHDATHMPLERKTAGVGLVEALCGYPVATTLDAMRYHHLRHHRDSGMATDPYFKAGRTNGAWWILNTLRGALLVPFWTVRALVGGLALAIPRLRNAYGHVFLQDRTRADLTRSHELIACARAEIGQLAFQVPLVAAAVAYPRAVVAGYVVPVIVAGVLAARRLLLEHNYERVADRRVETIIATTNDHDRGLLGAILLAPRNNGYHIVHHIHPQVSLVALPALRDWYVRAHPAVYPSGAR